jgi:seryl-tRNA synthetase
MGVKVSQDEDADNEVVSTWGTPRDPAGLLNHHDLLWRIGGYEPERGVAVAGHRGYFLKDMGVMLNQAFINYGIAFLRKKEYSILQPPYMMKKSVMSGVAQLEQFDEELYKVSSGTSEDNYLIATSEQPICGFHMGEWIEEKSLPLKYSGVSTCFRKEAGSHGKDTWGIFRVHQFEKVEQFVIVEGDLETSKKMQEQMSAVAEEFYQSLGFPYQVISIVTGALNNAAIKKLDLECWFPGYNAYRELVSCSNCTDYQSRSMEIRCGQKKLGDREKKYVHMLNSTLCATGRAICCLLETYQVRPNCITLVNY